MKGKVRSELLSPRQRQGLRNVLERFFKETADQKLLTEAIDDLLTESEQVMLGRRVMIARKLLQGRTKSEICRELRIGQATVEHVNTWLRKRWPDYRALAGKSDRSHGDAGPFSLKQMRRRYPLHFLIWNLVLQDIDWSKPRRRT